MTTKEKLKVFELTRTHVVNYYWMRRSNIKCSRIRENYICVALKLSYKSLYDDWYIPDELFDILIRYKPNKATYNDSWWSTDDLGMRKRIEVLDDIIKNLKLELSNESSNIN